MFRHWAGMVRGGSYWHQEQGVGRQFQPGALHGYFNDLTGKATWPGETDSEGLPLCRYSGRRLYWPVTVAQKGLAHWDLWLESGRTSQVHWNAFERVARWLLRSQDDRGGWEHPVPVLSQPLSKYSCMSQGQAASILARAFDATGSEPYIRAARRGLEAMLVPTEQGGTAVYFQNQVVLEEYPSAERATVLNGWIFAIFGLYDFELAAPDEAIASALRTTLQTLAASMPRFDCGYWSRYDSAGMIASPFYHRLHVAQLAALARAFPEYDAFAWWRDRFNSQSRSSLRTCYAVGRKALQKLMHPPEVVLEA